MDQIKELLNILKETPQMALWGLVIYFLFMLLKLASWVGALTLILKQLIQRYFDSRDKLVEQSDALRIMEYFESQKIGTVNSNLIIELLGSIKSTTYIHESDIKDAIRKLNKKD